MVPMSETPGLPGPPQELEVFDSYIDVDFAKLFDSSVSIADDKSEFRRAAESKPEPNFADEDGVDIHKTVDHGYIIGNDQEVDPFSKIIKSFILTPEPSQYNSRSSSVSRITNLGRKVCQTAQTAIIPTDSTTHLDTSTLIHLHKEDMCNHSNSNISLTTPPTTPLRKSSILIPTTRIDLRALYEKFPDICPSISASPPTFFNRGFNQQSYFNRVRSAPTTPRKYGAPDSRRLAESFASRTPLPSQLKMPPRMLKESLRDWYQMPGFMAKCRRDQEFDPYPHLNLNEGWNRARCQGELWHDLFSKPWQNPNTKILDTIQTQEQLLSFSWSKQVDSIVVDGGLAEGVFEKVFHGIDGEKERMVGRGQKRTPGSWWRQGKRLFHDIQGRGFREELHMKKCQIWDGVKAWTESDVDQEYGKLKRKIDALEEMAAKAGDSKNTQIKEPNPKRIKVCRKISQIASDKWRARRRSQEKKAGRWTDKTPLQNRMWAEFHWVLDANDHHDRRFFDTRDWPRIFDQRGWPGITANQVWAEFYNGWGPLQSWLYRYGLAAQHQYRMYRERETRQRRQRQWADVNALPDSRYGYVGYYR
ncbi:hypothetical protein NHQ30_000182 [Ciborinia camelliae]|nr:hypothetical protein NHQ30_000182 [Ciborinia camelliae]